MLYRTKSSSVIILVAGLAMMACDATSGKPTVGHNQPTTGTASDMTSRTTCPDDDVVHGSCVEFLHQQPRAFWGQYQREAPALREGFLACTDLRDDFGDWVRLKRDELRQKDRQVNMVSGYLPHSVVAESDLTVQQMANAFIVTEYNQIINRGARSELCQERIAHWKAQILGVTEKFPPVREPQQHDGDGWYRPR